MFRFNRVLEKSLLVRLMAATTVKKDTFPSKNCCNLVKLGNLVQVYHSPRKVSALRWMAVTTPKHDNFAPKTTVKVWNFAPEDICNKYFEICYCFYTFVCTIVIQVTLRHIIKYFFPFSFVFVHTSMTVTFSEILDGPLASATQF